MYVKKTKNESTIIYLSLTLIHFPADSVLSDEFFSGRNQEKEARARGPPRRHPSLTTVSLPNVNEGAATSDSSNTRWPVPKKRKEASPYVSILF